ncbi:CdaR family transcriptional regulator [Streptomyces sp. NBC_00620]|uniref:PucR family transcriptional regulator n=1 Tax=Streptomyces sp. NBC_00620 TaxID=2903666 RepID=UPI002251536C|nr:helix-turn-helix domain-containing protein [Streptomyces sp. NBC_00620]MCX4977700.1 helix-turn-helix domain-containing protein [Streptomyces sp. NBC_00620]
MSVEQIQTLVDALATRLGRAVVVDDQELRLVAVSEDFGDADPARIWSLLHRRTRPEDVCFDRIKRSTGPGHIPENPDLELWQRLYVPIRCRGLLLGFVWITDRYGDLPDVQIADATRTAETLGSLMYGRWLAAGHEHGVRRQLVEQLLSQDAATRRAAREEVLDRGLFDVDGPVAVLLAGRGGGAEGEDAGPAFAAAVERFCRGWPGASVLAACRPRRATVILALRPADPDAELDRAAHALLAELTAEPALAGCRRVGAGGPVPALAGLPTAKRQADIALSAAGTGTVALWSGLGAHALLAQLAPPVWDDTLIPQGVLTLFADPSAAVLVPTLETYLDCAGDVQRTARELCVHRTTLYYRLGRAEQISGLSLRDGRDRLLLHLVLGLRRLHGAALPGSLPRRTTLPTYVESEALNVRRRAG